MPGFRKGWIPFGDNYGGDNMVLDFASTEPKKRGRVLQFNHEYAGAVEVAPSFEKYLQHIAAGLASKTIIWDADSGLSYKKGMDWDDLTKKKQVEYQEEENEPAAKPPPKAQGIVGRWKVIENDSPDVTFAIRGFRGDTIEFTSGGDFIARPPPSEARFRRQWKYRYRCVNKHEPPWIDLIDRTTRLKSRCLGIYRIEGDELLMCTGQTNDPRPNRFDRKKNKSWISYRMTRA